MEVTRAEINKTKSVIFLFLYALKSLDLLDDKSKKAYAAMNTPWYTSLTAKMKTLHKHS